MDGDRCAACESGCRFVGGDGPEPCDWLLIGEKPGREEANRGRPFVGDSGRETDSTYLGLAGLSRPDVRITNTVKCRLGGNNNAPTAKQVRSCGLRHIPGEVERARPQVIVLLGATACGLVPKVELERDHGYPVWIGSEDSEFFGGWEGWVAPMYHPAAGLHRTGMMTPMLEDWERVGRWWGGKWRAPADENIANVDYKVVETAGELWEDLKDEYYEYLPVDTERDGSRPWSLQYSTRPGRGRLIFADRKDLLEQFAASVAWGRSGYLLHNAPQDMDMLEAMGVGGMEVRDTMQEAHQLQLPQSLKTLGWRLLGVGMRSWKELVGPPSRQKMVTWLVEEWDRETESRECVTIKLKTREKVLRRPTQREKDLKRILSHAGKDGYDVWGKAGEAGIVGGPIRSIAHVGLEEAVRYACQDADVTGRMGEELRKERERRVGGVWGESGEGKGKWGEWNVREEDWDR